MSNPRPVVASVLGRCVQGPPSSWTSTRRRSWLTLTQTVNRPPGLRELLWVMALEASSLLTELADSFPQVRGDMPASSRCVTRVAASATFRCRAWKRGC